MKLQAASPNRSGSFLGPVRRPTAAPLRLHQQTVPFICVTQQSAAAVKPSEQEQLEDAMRARKDGAMASNLSKPAMAEAQDLRAAFNRIQSEVQQYRKLNEENGKLKEELVRLQQETAELTAKVEAKDAEAQNALESLRQEVVGPLQQEVEDLAAKLAAKEAEQQQAMEAARQEAAAKVQQQLEELAAKLAAKDVEQQHVVEAAKLDVTEPLRQELQRLEAQLVAKDEELQRAVEQARVETAGPLQQQLDELGMQLQNAQGQLERLGEAVEATEAAKVSAVQALEAEKQELLLSLASATRRLADIVYPPGSLPAGLAISTRLEGDVDLEAVAAARAREPAAMEPASSTSSSPSAPAPAPAPTAASKSSQNDLLSRFGGFFSWVLSFVSFWVYQVLGALLLYYAAAILQGAPPVLNTEFCIGCVVVCTLLAWGNRFLTPPRFA